MENNIKDIIRHFFGKETILEVPETEVEEFVSQYPYLSVGHYLLALRNHIDPYSPVGLADNLKTAALYINNPLWLQWLLDNQPEDISETSSSALEINGSLPEDSITDPTGKGKAGAERLLPDHQTVFNEENIYTEETVNHNEPPLEVKYSGNNYINSANGTGLNSLPGYRELNESLEALPPAETAAAAEGMTIPFQSYHTIDYFASQGIKLRPTEFPGDKLGQQMKSFTEWLRSMKKLPVAGIPDLAANEPRENIVAIIAESSIQEKEVLTETMAEVWAKQGNVEKARAIYEKLSLQNPQKIVYFATKIDQLNIR